MSVAAAPGSGSAMRSAGPAVSARPGDATSVRRDCSATITAACACATVAWAAATAPSAWCWSACARSPALSRLPTSAAIRCALSSWPCAVTASARARCQFHQASRTAAATRSWAAVVRLSTARPSASASAWLRPRSPGSHRGIARPASYSRVPRLRFRRSVLPVTSTATGSGVQDCAACCCARAASRRAARAASSGWRAHAASKAWLSVNPSGFAVVWANAPAAAVLSANAKARASVALAVVRQRACVMKFRRCIRCSRVEDNSREIGKGDPAGRVAAERPSTTARGQARTGFRKKKWPPRRSGEGCPLRALGRAVRQSAHGAFIQRDRMRGDGE